ncbi:MAG TPA: hypothetical protein VJ653_09105 [Acidimicrobiales bacterium]|nr:hypothetical protein [Acidimicrobiales bacterium]
MNHSRPRPSALPRAAISSIVLLASLVVPLVVGVQPAAAAPIFSENFDGVSAPNLPPGWTNDGDPEWVTTTARADTSPNSAQQHGVDALVRDLRLTSPTIVLPTGQSRLTFRHSYDIQDNGPGAAMDGAVLEIKVGDGSFRDIVAAGGSFVTGGYNSGIVADGTIFRNVLINRLAWSGESLAFQTVVVNLPAAASGQPVVLRWRFGTDNTYNPGISHAGWFVDSIVVDQPNADLQVSKSGPSQATAGDTVTYAVTVENTGPDPAATVSLTDTLPAGLTFVSVSAPADWTCPTTPPVGESGTITCRRATLPVGGPQTFEVVARATASGPTTNVATVTAFTIDDESTNNRDSVITTVAKASPTIATQASAGGPVGSTSVTDRATLTGGSNPSGTVTFRLFGDSSCTVEAFTSTTGLTGSVAVSEAFTPQRAGTYYWTARYNGDVANNPATSPCQAPDESVTIVKASPTLSTTASPGNLVGASVRDVATLAGAFSPTGSVTFRLFSDASCAAEVFNSTNAVSGTTATSGWSTPPAAGTYQWTAVYAGDVNNNPATSPCGAPNEAVTLAPFEPPAVTRTLTGDVLGPVTVASGESVLVVDARLVGPLTVQPGGALTVLRSKITGGMAVNAPRFLSVCGSEVSGPVQGQALGVANAGVPIRIGDPAAGCAGNRFAGSVSLTANLATTFAANVVSTSLTVTGNGPGNTVLPGNTVFGTLGCTGNDPAPANGGSANTAASKTGQCAGL